MTEEETGKVAKEAEEKQAEATKEEPAEVVKDTGAEEKTKETLEELLKEEEPAEEAVQAEKEAPVEAEKEEKPSKEEKAKKEEEEEIVEERIYTVPLGKAWIVPPNKRAPRAIRMLKAFITKHMKLAARKEDEGEEEEEAPALFISNEVNERIWVRGIQKPPRKLRVRAAKDKEGNVTVYLAEGD